MAKVNTLHESGLKNAYNIHIVCIFNNLISQLRYFYDATISELDQIIYVHVIMVTYVNSLLKALFIVSAQLPYKCIM